MDYAFQNNREKKWMWWDFCAFSALFPAIQVTHLPKKIAKGFYFDATSPPHCLLTPNKKKKQHKKCFRCVLVLWFLSSHLQFWSDSIQISPSHSAKATRQSEKGDVVWRFGSEQMLRQITHCVEGRRGLCVKRWVCGGENRGEIIIHQHVSLCQVHPQAKELPSFLLLLRPLVLFRMAPLNCCLLT